MTLILQISSWNLGMSEHMEKLQKMIFLKSYYYDKAIKANFKQKHPLSTVIFVSTLEKIL